MKNQKTDFKPIVKALNEAGITDYAISNKTGIERSKITKIRLGTIKMVDFDSGILLMKLADEVNVL